MKLGYSVIDLSHQLKALGAFIEARLTTYVQLTFDGAQSGCFQTRIACYFDNQGKCFHIDDCQIFDREIQNIKIDLKSIADSIRQIAQLDKIATPTLDKVDDAKSSADHIQDVVRQRLMNQWGITL